MTDCGTIPSDDLDGWIKASNSARTHNDIKSPDYKRHLLIVESKPVEVSVNTEFV